MDQVKELLDIIDAQKKKGVTGASVMFAFFKRRIQPIQHRHRTCWEQMRASPLVCHALGRNETTLGATTLDVVEVALCTSSSNKLGISQSSRSILLGKMQLLSRATVQGRGGSRYAEGLDGAEGSIKK
jgi:hypothetical protein